MLAHPAGFAGATAYGTLAYVGPDAAERAQDNTSLIGPVLLARFLGDAMSVRRDIVTACAAFSMRPPRLWYS